MSKLCARCPFNSICYISSPSFVKHRRGSVKFCNSTQYILHRYSCYCTSSSKVTTTTASTKDYAVSSSLGISTKGKGSCTISSSLCATYIYPRTTILFLPLVSSIAKSSSSSKGYRCSLTNGLTYRLCSNTKGSREDRSRTDFYSIASSAISI